MQPIKNEKSWRTLYDYFCKHFSPSADMPSFSDFWVMVRRWVRDSKFEPKQVVDNMITIYYSAYDLHDSAQKIAGWSDVFDLIPSRQSAGLWMVAMRFRHDAKKQNKTPPKPPSRSKVKPSTKASKPAPHKKTSPKSPTKPKSRKKRGPPSLF